MSETEIPHVLDMQEAYIHDRAGTLHRPINAEPDDDEDWRRCETCGADLYAIFMCADAPVGRCGCPLYMVRDGEHLSHDYITSEDVARRTPLDPDAPGHAYAVDGRP